MKTIKKMYKRLLAFTLAAVMVLSYSVAVSASELSENSSNGDSVIEYEIDESGTIITYSTDYINHSANNMSSNSKYTDSFTLSRSQKLYVNLKVEGTCHIVVKFSKGIFWSNFLNETITNEDALWYSTDLIGEGLKVTVTLTFSNGSNYSIRVWGE